MNKSDKKRIEFSFEYKSFEALYFVAKLGNFEQAAKTLRVTQSAISQRLKQLESMIQQKLLLRTSPPKLTEMGEKIVAHYQRMKSLEESWVEENLALERHQQHFRIAVNRDSLSSWVIPALSTVLQTSPWQCEFCPEDQDLTVDLLKQGKVEACITSYHKPILGHVMHRLGTMRYLCVSTPAFAESYFRTAARNKALLSAPAVIFDRNDGLHIRFLGQEAFVHHIVPDSVAFTQMILQGNAYGLMPELHIEDALQRGTLVDLTPGKNIEVPLYWHQWEWISHSMEALAKAMMGHAQQVLRPQERQTPTH